MSNRKQGGTDPTQLLKRNSTLQARLTTDAWDVSDWKQEELSVIDEVRSYELRKIYS